MKFCSECGNEVNENAVVCIKCGCSIGPIKSVVVDESSIAYTIIGAFIPWYISLIIYFVIKDKTPLKAKSLLTGVIINIVGMLMLCFFLVFVSLLAY